MHSISNEVHFTICIFGIFLKFQLKISLIKVMREGLCRCNTSKTYHFCIDTFKLATIAIIPI